jgi:hypothetical protein
MEKPDSSYPALQSQQNLCRWSRQSQPFQKNYPWVPKDLRSDHASTRVAARYSVGSHAFPDEGTARTVGTIRRKLDPKHAKRGLANEKVHKRTQSHSWDAGRHPAHLAQVRFESQREQKSKAMLSVCRQQTAPNKQVQGLEDPFRGERPAEPRYN